MARFILLSSLILILLPIVSFVQTIGIPNGYTLIRSKNAYSADKALITPLAKKCISNSDQYKPKIFKSRSLELLIDLIERLEDNLANTTDSILMKLKEPIDVARLLLHRFHLDEVDLKDMSQPEYLLHRTKIDNEILGKSDKVTNEYYFPDTIYNENELCDLLFMFSHFYSNVTDLKEHNNSNRRFRRESYTFGPSSGSSSSSLGGQQRIYSQNYNVNSEMYPLREEGVVSFRNDPTEAIAPAKVLIGILAGLTQKYTVALTEIDKGFEEKDTQFKDAILAVTLASIPGTARFPDQSPSENFEKNIIFDVSGKWMDYGLDAQTSDNNYDIIYKFGKYYRIEKTISNFPTLKYSSRASMAQVRGALDGYIIGRALKKLSQDNFHQLRQLRLSNILRSYYSLPHLTSTTIPYKTINYCDRSNQKPDDTSLSTESTTYTKIFDYIASTSGTERTLDFISVLHKAAATSQEICKEKPQLQTSKTSKCETPSDLIFVIDSKMENIYKTSTMINSIVSKINKLSKYQGHVSIFINTLQKVDENVPSHFPMGSILFNKTNIGEVTEAFYQLKGSSKTPTPILNMAEYFKNLNLTITGFKYWTNKRFSSNGDSSKNVILLNYDDKLEIPSDKNEYYRFKDGLRYDNRDVRYLVIANDLKPFEEIIVNKELDYFTPMEPTSSMTDFAEKIQKRICENPAPLIYSKCWDKPSENVAFTWYITPGYKQNWFMHPQYFLKSYQIEFKVKAVEGSIRFCWYREFFEDYQEDKCFTLEQGNEKTFYIQNPCEHRDVYTCDSIYLTIWGKDSKNTICKDVQCQSLDQNKFTITHKGISCNSAGKMAAVFILQIICLIISFFNSNRFF